jgi:hypothetical protein
MRDHVRWCIKFCARNYQGEARVLPLPRPRLGALATPSQGTCYAPRSIICRIKITWTKLAKKDLQAEKRDLQENYLRCLTICAMRGARPCPPANANALEPVTYEGTHTFQYMPVIVCVHTYFVNACCMCSISHCVKPHLGVVNLQGH